MTCFVSRNYFDDGHYINIQYTADGDIVRKVYGTVSAQMADSKSMELETMSASASEFRIEERCGNHVYYNKKLERAYNGYGFWAGGKYYYNICDYLGNVRTVVDSDGALCERNDYYPYGMLHDPTGDNPDIQPHKYGSKELDRKYGLDLYDSRARWYDPTLGRTTTMDPNCGDYPWVSPYAWCNSNPVRLVDEDGKRPTEYEAALMAQLAYKKDLNNDNLPMELRSQNWNLLRFNTSIRMSYTKWYENGLQSYLFERTIDGVTEYALAFAGSNSVEDFLEDIAQLIGIAPQYNTAINNAATLSEELRKGELTFVGHSLGGGEAAAASMATGRAAITFNPAAVSPATSFLYGLGSAENIINFRIIPSGFGRIRLGGCFVNNLQDNLGMRAPGTTIKISLDIGNPFRAHSIDNFVDYFSKKNE